MNEKENKCEREKAASEIHKLSVKDTSNSITWKASFILSIFESYENKNLEILLRRKSIHCLSERSTH